MCRIHTPLLFGVLPNGICHIVAAPFSSYPLSCFDQLSFGLFAFEWKLLHHYSWFLWLRQLVILRIGIWDDFLFVNSCNSQTYLANCHSTNWHHLFAYWHFGQIVFCLLMFGQLSFNHCSSKLIWPVVILLIGSLVDCHFIIFLTPWLIWPIVILPTDKWPFVELLIGISA
jgi:hypothetical protein